MQNAGLFATQDELLHECTNRLSLASPAKRLFNIDGGEISSVDEILHHDVLVVSSGEAFQPVDMQNLQESTAEDIWIDKVRYSVVDQEDLEPPTTTAPCEDKVLPVVGSAFLSTESYLAQEARVKQLAELFPDIPLVTLYYRAKKCKDIDHATETLLTYPVSVRCTPDERMAEERAIDKAIFAHFEPQVYQQQHPQQPTTNNQQPTTNNQQPATNNQQPTTNMAHGVDWPSD
jgi:hypothetical protein